MTRQGRTIQRIGHNLIIVYNDGTRALAVPSQNRFVVRHVDDGSNPPAGGDGQGDGIGKVTAEMIETAVKTAGGSPANMKWDANTIADAFTKAIRQLEPAAYTSKATRAALVGECAQESDWFQTAEEYGHASGDANYWGRGFIQLTWGSGYKGFGQYMASKGVITDPDTYYNNPDILSTTVDGAVYCAIYYFAKTFGDKTLTQWCDATYAATPGNWYPISRAINWGSPFTDYVGASYDLRNTVINAVMNVTPEAGPNGSGGGQGAAEWMLANVGKFYYSQNAHVRATQPDSGGGDCSSTVVFAYVLGAGKTFQDMGGTGVWTPGQNTGYPGYTGTLLQAGSQVKTDLSEDGMAIGDLIIISYGSPAGDHVEMYIGNGQTIGHGGGNSGTEYGPTVHNIGSWNSAAWVNVRRYA